MHKIAIHIPYYLPLVGIFMMGTLGFVSFSYDKYFQVGIVVAVGAAHVVWGIVYHIIHRDISALIVLEYMIVAAFGVAAVLTALS